MPEQRYFTHKQKSAYQTPRSWWELCLLLLWQTSWYCFCAWTPKPFNKWRLVWLRLFGCKIDGQPFVHQRARIEVPWNLILHDRACLGDRANAYCLGQIELGARSTIAQEAYLCTGTHKFDDPNLPLQTARILVEEDAFVGARAFVMPGITIGRGAVIGACSVVTADMPAWMICFGYPCEPKRPRVIDRPSAT